MVTNNLVQTGIILFDRHLFLQQQQQVQKQHTIAQPITSAM